LPTSTHAPIYGEQTLLTIKWCANISESLEAKAPGATLEQRVNVTGTPLVMVDLASAETVDQCGRQYASFLQRIPIVDNQVQGLPNRIPAHDEGRPVAFLEGSDSPRLHVFIKPIEI